MVNPFEPPQGADAQPPIEPHVPPPAPTSSHALPLSIHKRLVLWATIMGPMVGYGLAQWYSAWGVDEVGFKILTVLGAVSLGYGLFYREGHR